MKGGNAALSTPENKLDGVYLSEHLPLNQAAAGATLQRQAVSLTVDKQVRAGEGQFQKEARRERGIVFSSKHGRRNELRLVKTVRGSRLLAGVGSRCHGSAEQAWPAPSPGWDEEPSEGRCPGSRGGELALCFRAGRFTVC